MAEQLNTQTKQPELQQIVLDKHEKFNNVISTATLPSTNLEKKISELFGSTFDDFEGCKIVPYGNMGQDLKCKLYFKPNMNKAEDGLYAVKVRGETNRTKPSSFYDMVNTVNMLSTSKQFELEDIAKELLAEFLVIPTGQDTFVERYNPQLGKTVKVRLPKNWNNFTEEITDKVGNTAFQNLYLVVNCDLRLIVAKMYGKKDEDEVARLKGKGIPKDRYQYAINIVKVINPSMNSFILEVRRIDTKEINELANSIGYGMVTGTIVMTRK